MIIAIDPGPRFSHVLVWDGSRIAYNAHLENCEARVKLAALCDELPFGSNSICIEKIASYGLAVGAEVFDTCMEIGRMIEVAESRNQRVTLVPRLDVKLHLSHSTRAKDANIRQALIDRFGGKEKAIGNKASPGPLYGVKSHAWAALALALTFSDTHPHQAT